MLAGAHALPAQNAPGSEPETVRSVDLNRYAGLWYEFARISNQFQRQCVRAATAEYSIREDGRLDVINRCVREDGSVDEALGIARVIDDVSNARLKVSFVRFLGRNLFWGDYWIVGLGGDYEYAIVGTPDRKYGWLLTREPEVSEDLQDEMFFMLEKRGYRYTDFERTAQLR